MNIITEIDYLIKTKEFDSCQFEKISITNGELTSKLFFSSVFIDCDLSSCDISDSVFRECKFINCNLSLSKFDNTSLHDIIFTDCKLIGIDWAAVAWGKQSSVKRRKFPISFRDCILNYSIFIEMDLYSASFIDSMMKEVNFADSNLESAEFKNVDLTDSMFRNTILQKADFSKATNYTINACTNSIKGAKFSLPEAISLMYALEIDIVE